MSLSDVEKRSIKRRDEFHLLFKSISPSESFIDCTYIVHLLSLFVCLKQRNSLTRQIVLECTSLVLSFQHSGLVY